MSEAAAPAQDRLAVWCGWVLMGAAVLTPLLGFFAPRGFAALLALMGLLCLPALRMHEEDRPGAVVLLIALVWAAISTSWSLYHPKSATTNTALKLALELPLYYSALCGARRADPRRIRLALRILAWGMAAFAALLFVEALEGAAIYRHLHDAYYQPIRPDLAIKNLGQSTFVLAVLWPLVAVGGARAGAPAWLAVPMAVGLLVSAHMFGSDAPFISVALSLVVGLAVYRWPTVAPRVMAGVAAVFFLTMPAIVWAVRDLGEFPYLESHIPLSWAMRMSYWSHAVDWIGDHPLRGWGLDSSRMFGPGIGLHPHDSALQLWLELGVLGAIAAALFWGLTLTRLSRRERDVAVGATAASTAVYLFFGAANFGIWQEWWLGVGGLTAVLAALVLTLPARQRERRAARDEAQPSTLTPISE